MKGKLLLIVLAIIISTSCLSNNSNSDSINDPIIAYLDSINSYIDFSDNSIAYTSGDYEYPNFIIESDSEYWGIAGNIIDSLHIHAVVTNLNDSTINFYHKRDDIWEKIGSDKVDVDYIFGFRFIDMNGDGENEIICFTHPNMNENMWPSVYTRSSNSDSIKYAGKFETSFTIKKDQKRLETDYNGSWMMPRVKTIYVWRNDKLVPIKRIQIAPKEKNNPIIEYFENPTYDQDSLKSIFIKDYTKMNKKLFDNFFENN